MEPIVEVILQDSESARVRTKLKATIKDSGDLELDGYDIGEFVEEVWGDSDYEYWLTIGRQYKDTVLLLLLQDAFARGRFDSDAGFRQWLDGHGIPNEFRRWI